MKKEGGELENDRKSFLPPLTREPYVGRGFLCTSTWSAEVEVVSRQRCLRRALSSSCRAAWRLSGSWPSEPSL